MTADMEPVGDPFTCTGERAAGQAARRIVRERAAKVVGDAERLDDIELMTAEAVANAVLHGSGLITVDVRTDRRLLRVEVHDEGPGSRDDRGTLRLDHGRGLVVIDALAAEWGLEQSAHGTYLWFTVDVPRM
ncbi:Histidine kinase-, DNA gyrase B-, and HSP90-like ATPase [Actinomadura rubteroloni]|uniref:Histidine kinase-, DNA gyrase B-, and HSP90-like ATPase n=1 Tax=Actinomadura rubteroloni TaxID=1926885 RepID=A0A2P4ULA1_9ACTN|nr:ATP-binding protein [Actinomadura rubteroloni]POM25824.1 Histidine kinase-, DNA gyrase B-, and HSP90-like ATPase [Actinomadura rubteroloni]